MLNILSLLEELAEPVIFATAGKCIRTIVWDVQIPNQTFEWTAKDQPQDFQSFWKQWTVWFKWEQADDEDFLDYVRALDRHDSSTMNNAEPKTHTIVMPRCSLPISTQHLDHISIRYHISELEKSTMEAKYDLLVICQMLHIPGTILWH